jgi:hypothetical protein
MARKTTGNDAITRSKRTDTPLQPVGIEGVSKGSAEVSNAVPLEIRNGKPVNSPVPINQNSLSQAAANQGSISLNLEEEIRHRAYELYLERRANGGDAGSPHHDWLTAEREILSRRNSRERKTA